MEKEYKAVPDAEELRYKGTSDKPDIKIFVSHRIDLDSATIDNPLYIPVRCGAVYDERKNVHMLGDDTGDNISEKRLSFCEFTVMYWAWKNIKADYYGLCHYRRYLSFLGEELPGPMLKQGFLDSMSHATLQKCGFLDEKNIRQQIAQTDAIVPPCYRLHEDWLGDYTVTSIKEGWLKYQRAFLTEEDFDTLLSLIKEKAPAYYTSAVEFLDGKEFYGFNCFVMRRDMFYQMCEFMFPIMFGFEDSLTTEHYSSTQKRAVGYLGEWLFSIFIYHHARKSDYQIEEHQLLTFQNTGKSRSLSPAFQYNNVPIVLTATDTNRALLGVQIRSILDNANEAYNYDFVILHRSYGDDKWDTYLKKAENRTLQDMVAGVENASLRFYDPKEELLDVEVREWDEPPKEELYYLAICPWVFNGYDKVIYLQDGLIANTDISQLYRMDLGDDFAAAPKNIYFQAMLNGYADGFKQRCEKKLRLRDLYDYVSTDVVLLNVEKVREHYSLEEVHSTIKKRKLENITTDGFNILMDRRIQFLSQAWNSSESWGPEYFRAMEYVPEETTKPPQPKEPYIFNIRGMSGQLLPQQSQTMKLFWRYARETPFYEELLLSLIPNWGPSIFDLQWRMGIFDTRSGARKLADNILPPGTKRRAVAKWFLPKGSLRWRFCKQIYYVFRPQYRSDDAAKDETEYDEDEFGGT